MLFNPEVSNETAEVVKQNPWLKHYLSFLAGISLSDPPEERYRALTEFLRNHVQHISLYSWSQLRIAESGIKTSQLDESDEIHVLMRYAVIYQDSDGSVKHQDSVRRSEEEDEDLLPSPQAIINDLAQKKQAQWCRVQLLGVVKTDSIFKTQEAQSYSVVLYRTPHGFQLTTENL